MAIAYYGRRNLNADPAFGIIGSGAQRAYVPNDLTVDLIAYRMGGRFGRYSGSPASRMGVGYASGYPPTPAGRIVYTNSFAVSTVMTTGSEGVVAQSDLTSPVLLRAGRNYSLVATAYGGSLGHGMIPAASIRAENESFYYKSGLSSTIPTNPIGGSGSNEGHMTLWVEGEINAKPNTPTALLPSGTLASGTTPVMASTFYDVNNVLPNGRVYDYVNQVQIVVRNASTGATVWNYTYTASTTERNADRPSRTYAGPALVAGQSYEWQTRHSDRAGAWSNYSAWTAFTISAGGTVGTPTSPTGYTSPTPSPFSAQWTSAGGLSTNLIQVRIVQGVLRNKTVLQNSNYLTTTVANNGTISMTWAQSGFQSLTAGQSYTIEMRARATDNTWSDWSSGREITISVAPVTPSQLAPANEEVVSGYPLLTAVTSDPDTAITSVTVIGQIVQSNGTANFRTFIYNSSTGRFQYQTTSADLPSYQTFTWRAYAQDGDNTSGHSPYASVTYAVGPTVAVAAPVEDAVLTNSTPTYSWTAADQVERQVRIYSGPPGNLIWSSGWTVTTAQTLAQPSGILRHGVAYRLAIDVRNGAGLTGTSPKRYFTVSYTQPPVVAGFTTSPTPLGFEINPSAVLMTWESTSYPGSQFIGYDIWRHPLDVHPKEGPLRLRRITSPAQTAFLDPTPTSGVEYVYTIAQVIQIDLDQLESPVVEQQHRIDIEGIMLSAAFAPETYNVDLRYAAGRGITARHRLSVDQREMVGLGASTGRTFRSKYRSWEPSGAFSILNDQLASAQQRITRLRALLEDYNGTICYRDDRGRKLYVTITRYDEEDVRPKRYDVGLSFRQEWFVEGEEV